MAKIIDYPRASLENGLQLAEAVSSLGGTCSVEMAAEKMGRKISGAFSALVSAAVKYGLVASKEGKLSTQPLYRSIKLAYSDAEKRAFLTQALLSPPLFRSIVERFDGKILPAEHFEKLLIREFDVPEDFASRVAQYFLQGSKVAGLLSANGVITRTETRDAGQEDDGRSSAEEADEKEHEKGQAGPVGVAPTQPMTSSDEFSISFRGPGLDSVIVIQESEDLLIVDAMLKKVAKALKNKE
jgi:hypothetical protein